MFNRLEQNNFTKSKLYLSTIGWIVNVTRRLNDKTDYELKKIEWDGLWFGEDWMTRWTIVWRRLNDKMDYDLKKMNEIITEAEVTWGWMIMSWWNLKSILEQRDDQNLNLQSIFYLGYQWWLSKVICLTLGSTLNGNFYYHPFLFRYKTATLTLDWGYALRNVSASIPQNILSYMLHVNHF